MISPYMRKLKYICNRQALELKCYKGRVGQAAESKLAARREKRV
jgi:hypothetical protein